MLEVIVIVGIAFAIYDIIYDVVPASWDKKDKK